MRIQYMNLCRAALLLVSTFLLISNGGMLFAQAAHGRLREEVIDCISRFARPCTFLEVGGAEYVFSLANERSIYSIAMVSGSAANSLAQRCQQVRNHRLMLLNPSVIDKPLLEKFGLCEHIDVVHVHADILPQDESDKLIDILSRVGEYVFIESRNASWREALYEKEFSLVAQYNDSRLFFKYTPKTQLPYARFSQKKPVAKSYEIISSLKEKHFKKQSLEKPIAWVHGINLVTFSLLQGVYPTDDMIREEIRILHERFPDHNDFVIGNMIVQGDRLLMIDVDDSRRSAKSSRCARKALKAFKKGNARLANPKKWMNDYYKKLSRG